MSRRILLSVALWVWFGGQPAGAGEQPGSERYSYSLWTKERIRYLYTQVQLNPYNAPLRVQLGNAYYADGQVTKAKEQLYKAVELQPDFAPGHCNLAVALQAYSQFAEARAHYEEALRLDSTLVEARVGLGVLLCRMDQPAEGVVYLERALEQDPEQVGVRYKLSVAYYKTNAFDKAIAHLETLLRSDSTYAGAEQALARAYYRQGVVRLRGRRHREAIELLDKALKYKAQDEEIFFAKGLAHLGREEYAAAESAFKEVVRLEQGYLPALQNLAAICEQTQRPQEAQYYYRQVEQWAPRWPLIKAARTAHWEAESSQ